MFKKIYIIIFFLTSAINAQDNWMLKGYVNGMTTLQTVDNDSKMTVDNTLHNRFDVNWYVNDHFTLTVGLRTRIIAGDNVSTTPNYSDYIGRDAGYFDMSLVWATKNSWIGVTQLDRLMIDYSIGNLQITVGRQRINWGQSFVWNPNDLFNSYSYFDFDYEERSGSDAIRMQYYIGESSKIEVSTSINSDHKVTSAFLYRFNTSGYDIQFLGGVFAESDYVIGSGFSGSIGGGGFSGEFTYYHPIDDLSASKGTFTATIHYDYTFKNSLNLQFETLYNGFGADDMQGGLDAFLLMDLSPKNIFPTKVTLFSSGAYNVTPLFRTMLSGMYGPKGDFLYAGTTFTYSMSDTMELAVIGQYFTMDKTENATEDPFTSTGTSVFLRLKKVF